MRVVFVSMETGRGEDDPPPGVDRMRRTARLLADRGHEVTWCCRQWWGGASVPVFEHDGVEYRRVTRNGSSRAFATRVPFALRKLDPDVVHVGNRPPGHAVAATTATRLLRVPLVVDWYDEPANGAGRSYRGAVRAADAVVTPSRTVQTWVREHGASEALVHVIPEGIDFDLVTGPEPDDRFDLVYSRDLDRHANVESFLLALAELRGRDWQAAVVGDGSHRETAEETARDLRIDDRVTFTGALPVWQRVAIFRGAHVFAQTATREPFARELLWGLACGCLGLVEYQAGSSAHELVEGRERARLVTSPQELADGIVDARDLEHRTEDEDFRDYDDGTMAERYLALYRDLADDYGLF